MDAKTPAKEMFDLPNVGLRLLFDEKQRQTSAAILLNWCLDPEAAAYMQKLGVAEPVIMISVTSPSGWEERYVVPFWNMQQRIIFRRPGKHVIRARAMWAANFSDQKTLRQLYLRWEERGKYDLSLSFFKNKEKFSGLGNAELELEVEDGFFAKEPSSWQKWWLELWWGPLTDDCSIRRRYAFAYGVQGPIILVWAFFLCMWRAVVAAFLSGFLLERNVRWYTVLHPFEYDTKDIWDDDVHGDKRSGWDITPGSLICYKDTNGNDRHKLFYGLWFFFPPLQVALLIAAVFIAPWGDGLSREAVEVSYVWAIGYACAIAAVIAICFGLAVCVVAAITWIKEKLPAKKSGAAATPKAPKKPNRFAVWLASVGSWLYQHLIEQPLDRLDESSRRREQERLSKRYMELRCDKAPEHGVRSFSQVAAFNKARIPQLLMDQIKTSKLCRPVARG